MSELVKSQRDILRGQTLGHAGQLVREEYKYFRPILETLLDPNGKEIGKTLVGYEDEPVIVEIRQPTVKERSDLINKCRNEDGEVDAGEFTLWAAIMFTYVPGTNERLYSAEDHAVMLEAAAGDFVDQFASKATEYLNLGGQEKNLPSSVTTQPSKQSTP